MALSNVTSPVSQSSALPSVSNPSAVVARSMSESKSSNPMANITSSSLADLARGVENLSAQMGMCAGGPFRNVQMQDNESDISNDSPSGGGGGGMHTGGGSNQPSMRGLQQMEGGGVGGMAGVVNSAGTPRPTAAIRLAEV